MAVFLIGDSHCSAIMRGARSLDLPDFHGGTLRGARGFHAPFLNPVGDRLFSDAQMQAGLEMRLADAGAASLLDFPGQIVVSAGLAPEPILGRLAKERFDFEPGYVKSRAFLSSGAVECMIEASTQHIIAFYGWLHERGLLRAAVAGPPLQDRSPIPAYFGDRLPNIRARFEAPIRAYLSEISCPIVEAPAETTQDGLLAEGFWGEDHYHASPSYGALVAHQVWALG